MPNGSPDPEHVELRRRPSPRAGAQRQRAPADGAQRTRTCATGTAGTDPRRTLGALGEEIAMRHLKARGFATIARNHRTRLGEIDLIAFDGRTLIFVEVKSRRVRAREPSSAFGGGHPTAPPAATVGSSPLGGRWIAQLKIGPLEGLRRRQRRRLRMLAHAWLHERRPASLRACEIRFDAIGVILDGEDRLLRLDHIEGAW